MILDYLNPYFWLVSFRNFLYDHEFFLSPKKPPIPAISIGNLSSGGTGKTSLVRFLADYFSKKIHVGILLRGYKRKSKGYFIVLKQGEIFASLDEAGDEAFMLSFLFQGNPRVSVSVCEKRVLGAEKMYQELGIELLLLDDAFQHRRIGRDLDLLLLKKQDLSDKLLPFGLLREPLSSIKRADAIILAYQEIYPFEFFYENKKIFKMYRKNFRIFDFQRKELSKEFPSSFIAFSGLGFNEQFRKILENLSIPVKKFISLPDHYDYKNFPLDPKENYLTTLKDFIKLQPKPNLYYLDFELEIPGLLEFIAKSLDLEF
ncbi:MAG: tetraacyldisaccharide 4'-kinase [Caldimicrobium sp.]